MLYSIRNSNISSSEPRIKSSYDRLIDQKNKRIFLLGSNTTTYLLHMLTQLPIYGVNFVITMTVSVIDRMKFFQKSTKRMGYFFGFDKGFSQGI